MMELHHALSHLQHILTEVTVLKNALLLTQGPRAKTPLQKRCYNMRAAKSGYNGHDFNSKWIVIYSQQIKNDKSNRKEKDSSQDRQLSRVKLIIIS